MDRWDALLDREIPDALSTIDLPSPLAAEVDYLAGRPEAWTRARGDVHPAVRARALVVAGEALEARRCLAEVTDGPWSSQGLAAATWAASRVGPPEVVDALAGPVAELADEFLVDGVVPLGARALLTGLLAAARGDLVAADADLVAAAEAGDRRAPVWGAIARLELARVRWCAGMAPGPDGDGAGDLGPARRALGSARAFFAAGGYRHLERRAAGVAAAADPATSEGRARPGLGHLVPGRPWTVGFGVEPPTVVRPSKGLVALRHLVANRDRPVPAVELDRVVAGEPVGPVVIGPEALAALVADEDDGGAEAAGELRALLFDDRVRSRTTKLVRRTIDKLTEVHPVLGRHLEATVRTGYACRYEGDPLVTWRLGDEPGELVDDG